MMTEELLTIGEVASFMKISNGTVYQLIYRNNLPAMKIANKWRFKIGQVEKWLTHQQINKIEHAC